MSAANHRRWSWRPRTLVVVPLSSLLALLAGLAALEAGLGAQPPQARGAPPQAEKNRGDDKTLTDYNKDCLRSGCHARMKEALWTHSPVALGACESCHEPRAGESAHRFQLTRPVESLCTFCHRPPEPRAVAHKPYTTGECLPCHDPHGSKSRALLAGQTDQERCNRCHDREIEAAGGRKIADVKSQVANRAHAHGPVARGECRACHEPHAGSHRALLVGAYPGDFYADFAEKSYELCFKCHDRKLVLEEKTTATGFRDGERNLHAVHVNRKKGRTCSVCHEPHASDAPSQIRKTVPFGPSGWELPINFKSTATGGSCESACHKKLSYERPAPPPRGK